MQTEIHFLIHIKHLSVVFFPPLPELPFFPLSLSLLSNTKANSSIQVRDSNAIANAENQKNLLGFFLHYVPVKVNKISY